MAVAELRGSFEEAGDDLVARAAAGLDAFSEMVEEESLRQCPVETGTLKESFRNTEVLGGVQYLRGPGGRFQGSIAAGEVSGATRRVIGYGFGDEVNPKTHRTADEYAAAVHEIIEAYHEPPTKAKFLEDPCLMYASMMEPVMASFMRLDRPVSYGVTAVLGVSNAASMEAGDRPAGALDAGDHPKGTPHV